jgi:hypothetical protein
MSGYNITDEDENSFSFHYVPSYPKFSSSITDGYGKQTNIFTFMNINQLRSLISYLQEVERNWRSK